MEPVVCELSFTDPSCVILIADLRVSGVCMAVPD